MNDYETGMAGMRDALKTHDALLNAFSRKLYAEQFKDYYMSLIPAMDAIEKLPRCLMRRPGERKSV